MASATGSGAPPAQGQWQRAVAARLAQACGRLPAVLGVAGQGQSCTETALILPKKLPRNAHVSPQNCASATKFLASFVALFVATLFPPGCVAKIFSSHPPVPLCTHLGNATMGQGQPLACRLCWQLFVPRLLEVGGNAPKPWFWARNCAVSALKPCKIFGVFGAVSAPNACAFFGCCVVNQKYRSRSVHKKHTKQRSECP